MIQLFIEGVSSALLPCSLTLAIPALAVALASRTESTAGLLGYGAALLGSSWLRFSDRSAELTPLTIAGLMAAGTVILVLPVIRRLDVISALGGLLVGVAAAALWEPCVGAAFGGLLDDLPSSGVLGLLRFSIYLIGVVTPMIGVGVVMHYLPDVVTLPLRPVMLVVGVVTLAVLSFTVAIGRQDEILARLTELSV